MPRSTFEETDADGAGGAAGDNDGRRAPSTRRRFLPSSFGFTVLLSPDVKEIEARVSWGDYRTDRRCRKRSAAGASPEEVGRGREAEARHERPMVDWVRMPERTDHPRYQCPRAEASHARARKRGRTTIAAAALTSRRIRAYSARYAGRTKRAGSSADGVSGQPPCDRASVLRRCELRLSGAARTRSPTGFRPRRDLSGYLAAIGDLRIADLHYRDLLEWAVGRNAAAGWAIGEEPRRVTRVWTDPLPTAEVERVAPNEDAELKDASTFSMEALARKR